MIRTDYIFNAAGKTITFANPVVEENIGIIANKDRGVLIYNSFDPAAIGVLSGQVLTLSYDTSTHSNSDTLQIFYSESSKHVTVDNSGTDIKISLDNETINVNVLDLPDIDPSLSSYVVITGDPSGDYAGQSILDQAITENSGTNFNVNIVRGLPKTDNNNCLLFSDIPQVITSIAGGVGQGTGWIDTTGYESIVVTFTNASGSTFLFQTTNDPAAPVAGGNAGGYLVSGLGVPIITLASPSAGATYIFPVTGRLFRVYCSVYSTQQTIVTALRIAPCPAIGGTNTAQIGGTNVVTGGVAGIQAVGGNIAPGSAATSNPIPSGGTDPANVTRRFQTDTQGNQVSVGIMNPGWQIGQYNQTFGGYTQALSSLTAANSITAPVMIGGVDTTGSVRRTLTDNLGNQTISSAPSTQSSQSIQELLYQILIQKKVSNFYLYELYSQALPARNSGDEPDMLAADMMMNLFQNSNN